MRIWVDDVRKKPKEYDVQFKSVYDTIDFIEFCIRKNVKIELISLDHDAGCYANEGGDYIKILDWMIENNFRCPVRLHTMNPVGRGNLRRLMKRYGIEEVIL